MAAMKLLEELQRRTVWQVLIVYVGASWVLLQAIDVFANNLDLPAWVFPTAGILLLVGLPVVMATLLIQRRLAATGEVADEAHEKLFTWRNALLGGAGAFLLLFGFAGLYVVTQDRGETFSPAEAVAGEAAPGVAVLPFSVRGLPEDTWREGIVEMLAMNLEGVSGIRPISPMTVFARWEEQSGDASQVDAATASAIARASGGRYAVVDGSIVAIGDQVRLVGNVVDLDSGQTLGPLRVEGAGSDVLGLLDEFSVALVRLIGTTSVDAEESGLVDLEEVTTSSPGALRQYLRGAHLCRGTGAEQIQCRVHLDSAVAEDSTFALALYALARAVDGAATVEGQELESVPLYLAARRHSSSHRLNLAIRGALAEQWSYGFWVPGVDEKEFHDAIEEIELAVRRNPSDAELWYWLGELYWHGAEIPGLVTAGVDRALEAFARARELVPGNAWYIVHPLYEAYGTGDTATVRELTAGDFALRLPPEATDWLNRAVLGDTSDLDVVELLDDLQELGPDSAWLGPFVSAFTYRDPSRWPLAREALERSRAAGDFRDCGFLQASLNAGQLAWYRAEAEASDEETRLECLMVLHQHGLPVSTAALDSLSRSLPEQFEAVYYAAAGGDWDPLESRLSIHRDAASLAAAEGDSTDVLYHEGQVMLGDAYRAWRQGRPQEAAEMADRLPISLRRVGVADQITTLSINRLARSLTVGIYRDAGRLEDAVNVLQTTFDQLGFTPALYDLGQIYTEMGEPERAREAYSEFIYRWRDADPELQPWVDRARTALARLGPLDQ